jgi:hypothetical protein
MSIEINNKDKIKIYVSNAWDISSSIDSKNLICISEDLQDCVRDITDSIDLNNRQDIKLIEMSARINSNVLDLIVANKRLMDNIAEFRKLDKMGLI